MKKKKIEHICGNCRLFDSANKRCKILVMLPAVNARGETFVEKINLPVDAEDPCFFEQEVTATDTQVFADGTRSTTETFVPADEIKEVKMWVEDPLTGEKTNKNGIVKIQYPDGFFGRTYGE
jgi:hypothetical protein